MHLICIRWHSEYVLQHFKGICGWFLEVFGCGVLDFGVILMHFMRFWLHFGSILMRFGILFAMRCDRRWFRFASSYLFWCLDFVFFGVLNRRCQPAPQRKAWGGVCVNPALSARAYKLQKKKINQALHTLFYREVFFEVFWSFGCTFGVFWGLSFSFGAVSRRPEGRREVECVWRYKMTLSAGAWSLNNSKLTPPYYNFIRSYFFTFLSLLRRRVEKIALLAP